MILHQVLELADVNGTLGPNEQLGELKIRREFIELVRLAAVLVIQSIELVTVLRTGFLDSIKFDDLCGNHASYDSEQGNILLCISTALGYRLT